MKHKEKNMATQTQAAAAPAKEKQQKPAGFPVPTTEFLQEIHQGSEDERIMFLALCKSRLDSAFNRFKENATTERYSKLVAEMLAYQNIKHNFTVVDSEFEFEELV